MKIKLLQRSPRNFFILFLSFLLLSATMPLFIGSGLDAPEPIGSYLNGNFPSSLPEGVPYQPVFPNISFDSPLTFNEMPSGNKIIVGQRDGKIFWFDKTSNVSSKNSLIDLSDKVGLVWDGGFLGLTLHPEIGSPGKNYFYVYYTTEDANSNDFPNSYTTQSCDSEEYWGNFLILARYELDPVTMNVSASSEEILLKLRMYGTTHRGGGLLFGDDGFLYLTTGDQTAFKKSQDIITNLDGGVLRLDVNKDSAKSHPPIRTMPNDYGYSDEITGNGYYIPNDNPFLSPSGENFEEYYSMGHRNPHRMTKDRLTGELYVGEIGGGRHEEINKIQKGKNFGWPLYEGLYYSTFCVQNLYNDMPHEEPLVTFPRNEANAIIGGYVYRGSEVPELQGKYICADYGIGEEIFLVDIDNGIYEQYGNFSSTNVISFGEDKQGEIYILKQGVSTLFKVTSKTTGYGTTPQFLSETGAFTDLENLTPRSGLIPYDLVESFWSDGAIKKRWMAIPNDGTHNSAGEIINYSAVEDWNLPVGTVLVKHFEMPINENNPTITKRLETRFSIKGNNNSFYFVTYKWNEAQTDAELLTSGEEESITIQKADGTTDSQTWSYPSSIDCVTCHNPETGGAIGVQAKYLNKDYTYSQTGRTANQLVTLSHLGILDQAITDEDTSVILTSKSQNDPNATLDEKARSYLDLNCAYCHRPGTGNRGDFDMRLQLDIVQSGLLTANPYASLGIEGEGIVNAGSPETSILYHRMNSVDASIKMPLIAKNKIDTNAVQLINDWISQLDTEPCSNRIIMETFNNVSGTTIQELTSNANYPDSPDEEKELSEFRIPVNVADNYGVRVKGLLKAPESGTYYFWVAGDDNVELSISTDSNANNTNRIAYHEGWTSDGQWNKFTTQKSLGVSLVAGQNYYIEALMNEGTGGDNLSVGWRKPSNGNGTEPFEVISCTSFDYFNGTPTVLVTDVEITPEELTIVENETEQLEVLVSPIDATDTTVNWLSSNTNVAMVDSDGLLTAVAEGTSIITATSNDGDFEDEVLVTVTRSPDGFCEDRIIMEIFDNVTGFSITELKDNLSYPDSPSGSYTLEETVIPYNVGDNYGVRMKGLLKAPETGTYYFWVTGDDHVELNLSSDQNNTNAIRIAYHEGWSSWNQWEKYPTQKSVGIDLVAGKNYYFEALMNELQGSDYLSVGWRKPSDGTGSGPRELIPCEVFDTFSNPTIVDVTGVSLEPENLVMTAGQTTSLNAIVRPINASNTAINWTSSNEAIATVNTEGVVTAVASGTVFITAETVDGAFTATSTIEVNEDNNSCASRIMMETYSNIPGFSIDQLKNSINFPNSPNTISYLESFAIPYNGGDDYGVRVRGVLKAPETGTYYFWITGDDNVELNLSTDNSAANKVRIAYHERWSNWNQWNKYATQKSVAIQLVEGEVYYIEGLMNELRGSDYLAVGWRKPSDGIGEEPAEVIPCTVFDSFLQGVYLKIEVPTVEESLTSDIRITPNPASNEAWVSVAGASLDLNSKVTYEVYDAAGQLLISLKGGTEEILNVQRLSPGIYFVVAHSGEWIGRQKLIVK